MRDGPDLYQLIRERQPRHADECDRRTVLAHVLLVLYDASLEILARVCQIDDELRQIGTGDVEPCQYGDGAKVKVQGRSRLRMDSGQALRDAAIAGLGVAFLPDFLVADDLSSGRLQQVLPRSVREKGKIVAIYPTRRLIEPRVRGFIDLMLKELET